MQDVLSEIYPWYEAGETFGLATVVGTSRSAPRRQGAAMAVSASGAVVGSVSGGCVEGAVYEVAEEVRASGRPVLQTYGVSDDDAFAVGLTCGGIIDIFVEQVSGRTFPELPSVVASVNAAEPVAVATLIQGLQGPDTEQPGIGAHLAVWPDRHAGTLGADLLDANVVGDCRGMLDQGMTGLRRYGADGQRDGGELAVFVESFQTVPRMLVFGAVDSAAAVVHLGSFLGYRVTVCDARSVFTTRARFPEADEVVVRWPHEYLAAEAAAGRLDARTAIVVLTHDHKFDVPLLTTALRLPGVAYIGALGSRRTHQERAARLREAGLTDTELARLSSPVGLDLGARTPQETAVSIVAELIAGRWGGTGVHLSSLEGPIHAIGAGGDGAEGPARPARPPSRV
jgi:xanthine dehydrogenase accessory factor